MGETVKLTEAEADFVVEMRPDYEGIEPMWRGFYPGFRQADIARLVRRGWFERRGKPRQGNFQEYRWTDAGRAALPPTETPDA